MNYIKDKNKWLTAQSITTKNYGKPGDKINKKKFKETAISIYKKLGGTFKLATDKKQQIMLKEAPQGVVNEDIWKRAKAQTKKQYGSPGDKLPEDRWYANVSHIYQNMGGKYEKKKESSKTVQAMKCADCGYNYDYVEGGCPKCGGNRFEANKENNDSTIPSTPTYAKKEKHTCPCGASMSKVKDAEVNEGWSKWECSGCNYSRDFRDGAPVYQAILSKDKNTWVVHSNGSPVFGIKKSHSCGDNKELIKKFNHITFGQALESSVAKQGALKAIEEWYPDREGIAIYHPGLKKARRPKGEDYASGKSNYICNKCGNTDDGCKCKSKKEAFLPVIMDLIPSSLKEKIVKWLSPDEEQKLDEYLQRNYFGDIEDAVYKGLENIGINPQPFFGGAYANKKAQLGGTDLGVAEPGLEDRGERPDEGGKAPEQDQRGDALVGDEVSDELMGEKPDHSNITESISDILATIIANSDITIEDAMSELKEVFTQGDSISEFRGKLEEKINTTKEDNVEDTIQDEQMQEPPPEHQQPSGASPQLVAAQLNEAITDRKIASMLAKKWEQYSRSIWDLYQKSKQNAIVSESKANEAFTKISQLEKEIVDSKQIVENLLIERSARIRAPRAINLANKCLEIGELGDSKNKEDSKQLIANKLKVLMKMNDEDFLKKESEVERIHKRLNYSPPLESNTSKTILSFIPNSIEEGAQDKINFDGRPKESKYGDISTLWSRPHLRRR